MNTGVHNISITDYHKNDTHYSSTQLKKAKKSMAHFHAIQEFGPNPCFDFGNAFELALIDPDSFDREVNVRQCSKWVEAALDENPNLKSPKASKTYKELQKNAEAEFQGQYTIDDEGDQSLETINQMLESCRQDPFIMSLTAEATIDQSYFWTDPASGLQMKSRPDLIKEGKLGTYMVDVKTGLDFSPPKFKRYLLDYDLPLQAIMQIEGFETCTGSTVHEYYWLCVEKKAPYIATLYRFTKDQQESIKADFQQTKALLAKEIQLGKSSGYGGRSSDKYAVLNADIPSYYSTYLSA